MRRRCNPRGREAQIRFSRSTSVAQLLQGLQFVVWTSDETTQIPAARSRCIKAKHNVEKGEALTIVNVELLFKTYYRHELCSAFVVRRQQGLFSSLEQGRLEPARATNGLPGLSFFFFLFANTYNSLDIQTDIDRSLLRIFRAPVGYWWGSPLLPSQYSQQYYKK